LLFFVLSGSPHAKHGLHSLESDLEIQEDVPVFDVVQVVFGLGFVIAQGGGVFVVDLSPSGDSGFEVVAVLIVWDVLLA